VCKQQTLSADQLAEKVCCLYIPAHGAFVNGDKSVLWPCGYLYRTVPRDYMNSVKLCELGAKSTVADYILLLLLSCCSLSSVHQCLSFLRSTCAPEIRFSYVTVQYKHSTLIVMQL